MNANINPMTPALSPFSRLYGAVMKARRALYRAGSLRVHNLGVPVVSVGNLTTGGTGKTPLVEWIARDLAQAGRRVCILTRGYGRRNAGTRVVVSSGSEILSDADHAGDEPLLLAELLKGLAAVICDRDRVSAARWAVENFKSDAFILDDGFQHLRVARNFNVLTIDATNPWGNGKLLPAGILRESPAELTRADCILITRADDSNRTAGLEREINELGNDRPIFRSRMTLCGVRQVGQSKAPVAAESPKATPAAAFCAIGNPESFFSLLRRGGYQLCHTQAFRDHHVFTRADIESVARDARSRGAQILLTTAKDEVKLRKLSFEMPCYAADIEIEIEGAEQLSSLIRQSLNQR